MQEACMQSWTEFNFAKKLWVCKWWLSYEEKEFIATIEKRSSIQAVIL